MKPGTLGAIQPNQPSDEELVSAAQVALPAFEHLYRRYVSDVYRFCYRRVGTETDAADVTSIVFTRALANIQNCQPASFRPWLYAIARNVVTDFFRSNRPAVVLDESLSVFDQAEGPEELAIQHDQRNSLDQMLQLLSDDQRSVIELRLAGLSAVEIAEALGKTRNAIDQVQFRAVARLRQLLVPRSLKLEETY